MWSSLHLWARALVVALVAGLVSVAVGADEVAKKALVGGRLIDGFGARPLANSVILIHGDTIEAVGSVGSLAVPEGYEVISTEGMDVLPGLWENHAHLMINGHADYPYWQRTYADRFASEIMPASALQLLLAGITTARDLGAPLDASISVKQRIESGEIPGPRRRVHCELSRVQISIETGLSKRSINERRADV